MLSIESIFIIGAGLMGKGIALDLALRGCHVMITDDDKVQAGIGGGSGGTVAVLARRGSDKAIKELTAQLADETGETPYVFHGSSPGCDAFGTLRARSEEAVVRNAQQVAE